MLRLPTRLKYPPPCRAGKLVPMRLEESPYQNQTQGNQQRDCHHGKQSERSEPIFVAAHVKDEIGDDNRSHGPRVTVDKCPDPVLVEEEQVS